jgi:SAM-dependent methyltransferase
MTSSLQLERDHEDAWHRRAIAERFFEREGFRQLIEWNLAALRRAVPLSPSTRLLSLGCGAGEYELRLAPAVSRVVGLDLSEVAVAEARRRARAAGRDNVEFCAGGIDEVRLPEESFDVVIGFGVLHHLGEAGRRRALDRARRWLVTGGWLYVRDPNARGLLRRVAGRLARHDAFHSPNEAALSPDVVSQEFLDAGFAHPRIDYTDVFGGPLPWMTAAASPRFWKLVFGIDRVWISTPGLRTLASQFAVFARR